MRALAWLVLVGFAAIAAAAPAGAQENGFSTWRDPGGRFQFSYPNGWPIAPMRGDEGSDAVRMALGAASLECQIWALPKAESRGASEASVRQSYSALMSEADWVAFVGVTPLFRAGVELVSQSVDASRDWPVQRALLRTGATVVRATLQGRPGLELVSLCASFDGVDRSTEFQRVEESITAPSSP